MTRQEFDHEFAATSDNTEGYTVAQLATLNDLIFEDVKECDADDEITHSHVQNSFDRHCSDFDVVEAD